MTSLGGLTQGILGAMEVGGNITLVSGWNWYTGSDPTQIGPGQYDFETIVIHELGHTFGLGESADPASVMYYQLAPGEARTGLTVSDLSLLRGEDAGGQAAALATNLGAPNAQETPVSIGPQAGVGLGASSPLAGRSESAETQGGTAAALQDNANAVSAPVSYDAVGTLSQASEAGPVLPALVVANHTPTTPVTAIGSTFEVVVGSVASTGSAPVLGWAANSSPAGMMAQPPAGVATTPVTTGLLAQPTAWPALQPAVRSPIASDDAAAFPAVDRELSDAFIPARPRMSLVSDSVLDELATDAILWQAQEWDGTLTIPVLPPEAVAGVAVPTGPTAQQDQRQSPGAFSERLALLGLAAGLWGGAGVVNARKRRSGTPSLGDRKPLKPRSRRD
jgi:hypothetical protein